MSEYSRANYGATTLDMSADAGLRKFMLGVYNKLGLGLVLSGILAYLTSAYPPVRDAMFNIQDGYLVGYTLLGNIVRFAPLVMIFGSMFVMKNPSAAAANLLYWAMVATIGAGLGVWLLVYTGESVAQTFFITSAAFFGLSLFGYTTKRNLQAFGSFLIMAVIGLILAMVVNMFLKSGMMAMIISGIGVLIFSGLIAYDTQRLKLQYYQLGGDQRSMAVATSMGALSLYINFINLFQFLLMLLGNRR
ncbi:Bax inhibitor-1/YccA family protein [Woodsholea maritima]|uniref:Bax inhibitor-1/YccA family protein n=1 Tax=Woodsholea maritima TaxID=240237 RepID=UPI0003754F92|nr:Bax inhibitor-1/YccA family protein [Woodsholea maritima]